MFAQKRILTVSLIVLAAAAGGVISYALSHKATAAPMADDKSAQDLERAKQEWRDQERRFAAEMVKTRLEAAEQEDLLRIREQELIAARAELRLVRKRIDSIFAHMAQPKVPQPLRAEEKELAEREQSIHAEVHKARRKLFVAEEKMGQLERERSLQHDQIRARLNAAEEKQSLEQGASFQRRLQKAERELDRLRRQLAELQRPAQKPRSP